jgi:hypothetical protein
MPRKAAGFRRIEGSSPTPITVNRELTYSIWKDLNQGRPVPFSPEISGLNGPSFSPAKESFG